MSTLPALSDRLAVDVHSAQSLRAGARAGDEVALRKAAQQFEAMVVNIMLKTMRETKFNDPASDPFASQSMGLYRDMLDQQWASKLSESKGFGFADMLIERLKLEQAGSAVPAEPPAGGYRLRGDTVPGLPVQPAPAPAMPMPASEAAPGLPVPERAVAPSVSEASTTKPALNAVQRAFIERMRPHAEAAAAATGVPAEYIIAHAALESGWGRREIVGTDGRNSHNLFGIKATGWQGESVEVLTTEYRYGLPMKQMERFRAYGDFTQAFSDYAGLLKRRYSEALAGDADSFASGLQKGGYATDPNYAAKLRSVIASVGA